MGHLCDASAGARWLAQGGDPSSQQPPISSGHPLRRADLAAHGAIVYSPLETSWMFRKDGPEAPVAIGGRIQVSTAEGIRAAVAADMGPTARSAWMFAPELDSSAGVRVLEDWTLPPVDLWTVFPTGRLAGPRSIWDRASACWSKTAGAPFPTRSPSLRSRLRRIDGFADTYRNRVACCGRLKARVWKCPESSA